MKNFQRIFDGVDVAKIHHALIRQPALWNDNKFRTTYENTPHVDVDDIIVRYSSPDALNPKNTKNVQNDHGAVWYPAAEKLPQIKPVLLDLMRYVDGYQMDRCLITRLKPGGRILPHADNVGDYVHLEGIARYHIVIQGLPGSLYRCGDETVQMLTGEVWWFDAHKEHEIQNNSADDRIHLMADFRTW